MNWEEIQNLVGHLDLVDQVRFAELKDVEVPQDVKDQVKAELDAARRQEELASHVRFQFATKGQPDRVYLKTKALTLTSGDKPQRAKALFLETRAIDEAIAVLQRAKSVCESRGIPTAPTETERNAGLDADPQDGDVR